MVKIRILSVVMALGLLASPALAAEYVDIHGFIETKPQPHEQVLWLETCERAPRSIKTLWLKPGKIRKYFYRCTTAEGSEIIKSSYNLIKSDDPKFPIADRRSFAEKHPNLAVVKALDWIVVPALQAASVAVSAYK